MQNKIILTIAITVGLSLGGVMVWIWKISETSNSARPQTSSTESSTTADDSPLVLGVSSGDALSDSSLTGGSQANASAQSQGFSTSAQPNSQPSSTSNSAATTNDSNVTTEPSQFGIYDKYIDGQNGLFAELTAGHGAEATTGKKVTVNYRGWLTNGQMFDQNMDSAAPFSFIIGAQSVIPGWEQTISGMRVGSERLLIIPPNDEHGRELARAALEAQRARRGLWGAC
jgi:FKBP-type peptidyl-prolyl cis-trans isomerase